MGSVRSQRGVTFIELVIVSALAIVILTTGLSQYQEFMSNQRLQQWTGAIANDLRAAQQLSVSRRETIEAVFTPGSYTIRMNPPGGPVVKGDALPPDITSTTETVIFSSLGTTNSAATITLTSTVTNQTRQISISAITGRVRTD